MRLKPIDEQVVVLMGASSGIGRETARRFAQRGARVVVAARSTDALASLVDEIERGGGAASAVTADVTDPAQVAAVADHAVATYGRIDTWVQLAAVVQYGAFEQTTPAEWKRIIDVNLNGAAYGAYAALPKLRAAGGGALILVSSVTAKRAFPLISAYAAGKQGINALAEALRIELQHAGVPISVTNVMPASINTPLFDHARNVMGVKPKPASPVYQPGVVADVIVYAAEHPAREIYAGGAAKAMTLPQRVSPRLMDALVLRFGFRTQQTDQPESPDTPHNLWSPLPDPRTEGQFGAFAFRRSLYNTLATHPGTRRIITGAALGALAALLARTRRG